MGAYIQTRSVNFVPNNGKVRRRPFGSISPVVPQPMPPGVEGGGNCDSTPRGFLRFLQLSETMEIDCPSALFFSTFSYYDWSADGNLWSSKRRRQPIFKKIYTINYGAFMCFICKIANKYPCGLPACGSPSMSQKQCDQCFRRRSIEQVDTWTLQYCSNDTSSSLISISAVLIRWCRWSSVIPPTSHPSASNTSVTPDQTTIHVTNKVKSS